MPAARDPARPRQKTAVRRPPPHRRTSPRSGALRLMKRWLATVGLLALLVPATRAAAQADASRITGTVTATDGGTPVSGARVTVLGTRLVAETNAHGRYTILTTPGTYR